jgi:DNA-binding response OmpR family regulator
VWAGVEADQAQRFAGPLSPLGRSCPGVEQSVGDIVEEFGVLEALLRAAPAFLSTEELLEQVWDENADPFTNAVFVTLSRLRRKLGDPPLIETRPGVGYRITQPGDPPRDSDPP